jgi:putative chitinase
MVVEHPVGEMGMNYQPDVKMVQRLLSMNSGSLIPLEPIVADGHCGARTIGAIREFQRRNRLSDTGRIEPNDPTLAVLRRSVPNALTTELLGAIMLNASDKQLQLYQPFLAPSMLRYQITTPLRQAHFLAQLAHESDDLRHAEEEASGGEYEGWARKLGNTEPGDGVRFKGRGLIQITGRRNYTDYGTYRGMDFVTGENPRRLALDPSLAVDSAGWYWMAWKLNAFADADDVVTITIQINGGTNGLAERRQKLERAKWLLGVD